MKVTVKTITNIFEIGHEVVLRRLGKGNSKDSKERITGVCWTQGALDTEECGAEW